MSDIQAGTNRVAIQAATGQTYGEAGKQMAAQRAVPMGTPPTEVQRPVPGTLGSLTRPTERPMEPITAGAPFGAGMGMEQPAGPPAQAGPPPIDQLLAQLGG